MERDVATGKLIAPVGNKQWDHFECCDKHGWHCQFRVGEKWDTCSGGKLTALNAYLKHIGREQYTPPDAEDDELDALRFLLAAPAAASVAAAAIGTCCRTPACSLRWRRPSRSC